MNVECLAIPTQHSWIFKITKRVSSSVVLQSIECASEIQAPEGPCCPYCNQPMDRKCTRPLNWPRHVAIVARLKQLRAIHKVWCMSSPQCIILLIFRIYWAPYGVPGSIWLSRLPRTLWTPQHKLPLHPTKPQSRRDLLMQLSWQCDMSISSYCAVELGSW
jgi:hypothetical protein